MEQAEGLDEEAFEVEVGIGADAGTLTAGAVGPPEQLLRKRLERHRATLAPENSTADAQWREHSQTRTLEVAAAAVGRGTRGRRRWRGASTPRICSGAN